ncbi:amidohydrolase family protein [Niallia sp. FSL W8-0635]|uniref:amidohydrolase family protein n=1 Tax=Niallia sp. FSL W8-0635 TaxID=2975337 RepID=UPI0030F96C41
MMDVQLTNVSLPLVGSEKLYTVVIQHGIYTKIEPQTEKKHGNSAVFHEIWSNRTSQQETIDMEGRILLPSFIDIHTHLDKAFSLKTVPNKSGTLIEAIRNYSEKAAGFSKEEIKKRVMKGALQALSYGTTHIRTHVNFEWNISNELALSHLQAVLEAKELLKPYITLQVVPMFSDLSLKHEKERDVLKEAISYGIDGIGGAPHLSPNATEDMDQLFALAVKYDKFLDLHVDEQDNPEICTIQRVIDNTKKWNMQGRVTAGHLCSLSAMTEQRSKRIIEEMALQQIAAVTLPGANMYLQGRDDKGLVRRGITRVREMLEKKVLVATASDNVSDPFHPFGRFDLLQIGLLTAYTAHLASEEELLAVLKMITETPAIIFGKKEHGIKEGAAAEFVLFDATNIYDLFANLSPTRYVYKNREWISGFHSEHHFGQEKISRLVENL